VVTAASNLPATVTHQQEADVVVAQLRREAGALGANGILFEGLSSEGKGTYITTTDANGAKVTNLFRKKGQAVAIYVR
jgi:hypothetical protein